MPTVPAEVNVPHKRCDLGTRQHFTGASHQRHQERKLARRQVDALSAARGPVAYGINLVASQRNDAQQPGSINPRSLTLSIIKQARLAARFCSRPKATEGRSL